MCIYTGATAATPAPPHQTRHGSQTTGRDMVPPYCYSYVPVHEFLVRVEHEYDTTCNYVFCRRTSVHTAKSKVLLKPILRSHVYINTTVNSYFITCNCLLLRSSGETRKLSKVEPRREAPRLMGKRCGRIFSRISPPPTRWLAFFCWKWGDRWLLSAFDGV